MIGYIYELKNKINKKSYIGQTIDLKNRISKHKSVAKTKKYKDTNQFYNDLSIFGLDNFELNILESCDQNLLDDRERYWIKKLNTIEPNGYNILPGGHKLFNEENPFFLQNTFKCNKTKNIRNKY